MTRNDHELALIRVARELSRQNCEHLGEYIRAGEKAPLFAWRAVERMEALKGLILRAVQEQDPTVLRELDKLKLPADVVELVKADEPEAVKED